jgi:putative ABC transport system ATP-binding protein
VQDGAIQILDRKLAGLSRQELVNVRRNLGFIFQMHNFDYLTAYENITSVTLIPPALMLGRKSKRR